MTNKTADLFTFLFSFFWSTSSLMAQDLHYVLPDDIETDQISITFEKVKTSSSSYYVNYTLKNKGNGHIFSERSENSLVQNGGKVRPTSSTAVIPPGARKIIYNEMRVKAPVQARSESFDFNIKGLQYAKSSPYFVNAGQMGLAKDATFKAGNFDMKVRDYSVSEDRIFMEIKCFYNGDHNHVGAINLEGVKVVGTEAKIVKKGDILKSGEYYVFAINIYSTTPNPVLDWGNAFQERILKEIAIPKLTIQAVGLKTEKTEETVAEISPETKPLKAEEGCALTYTDFNTLRNDIATEAKSGGDAVGLASEFMVNKSCINTAQVVELMDAFTMDGHRLDFAKMAYPFTSDRQKYSQVVQKLSYNKNKEAMEEFLGNQ